MPDSETAMSVHSLDIASTGDNKVRILQSSTGNNAQIMFSRLDNNGNDYGPEILFDKSSGADHSVDSLNFIATDGNLGMNISWDGKVGIGGINSTGDNLLVNGTLKCRTAGNTNNVGIEIKPHGTINANAGGRIVFKESTDTIPRGFTIAYNGGSDFNDESDTTFKNLLKSACPEDCFGILRHNGNSGYEGCAPTVIIKRGDGNVGIGTTNQQVNYMLMKVK